MLVKDTNIEIHTNIQRPKKFDPGYENCVDKEPQNRLI